MRYYIMPTDAIGNRAVIAERDGKPVNMDNVDTIDLPVNNGWLHIISRNKDYPDHKVARAVVAGQIDINDVTGVTQ